MPRVYSKKSAVSLAEPDEAGGLGIYHPTTWERLYGSEEMSQFKDLYKALCARCWQVIKEGGDPLADDEARRIYRDLCFTETVLHEKQKRIIKKHGPISHARKTGNPV